MSANSLDYDWSVLPIRREEHLDPAAMSSIAGPGSLSIAIIDPMTDRHASVLDVLKHDYICSVHSFAAFISHPDQAIALNRAEIDVVFVGVDRDPEAALFTVESICSTSNITVMLYSSRSDSDLLLRGMRAGAREFFMFPFEDKIVHEAFARTATRLSSVSRESYSNAKRKSESRFLESAGRMHVFCGAKGGAGVTTIACNFSASLALQSSKKVALLDLNLPLGDAALNFGVKGRYSTLDALSNTQRLDGSYLSGLMVEHTANLAILAAPGTHNPVHVRKGATERLLTVARRNFDEVVVDAGSHWSWMDAALFEQATAIYLVTQVGISELRNANRVITGGLSAYGEKLEIILNRHEPTNALVEDDVIEAALTRSATWRVPSDYMTIRDMQTLAKPFVLTEKPIAQSIQAIARKALGIQPQLLTKPKRILGIF